MDDGEWFFKEMKSLLADSRVLIVDRAELQMSVPDFIRKLVGEGAAIEAVVPEERPREDAYLQLVQGSGGGA